MPVAPAGDAGHGEIDSEELITVRINASGLTGQGYAYTIGRGGRAVQALIEHDLRPLLIGLEETDVEGLWDLMWHRLLYVGRGGLASFAVAAVDIALWDLRGLRAGQPLYRLLGGEARHIPVYGSGVDLPKPLPELLRQVEGFIERGLPGVKIKLGRAPAEDAERVRAVRRLIGDERDLMLDANMAFTVDAAVERGRRLREWRPLWFEEPLVPEDVEGHARLIDDLGIPVAIGESLHSPFEFERYLSAGAVGVLQVDPVTNGGITASMRALRLADSHNVSTSSHYCDELAAHLLSASANAIYLEKHAFSLDRYLEEPQMIEAGSVRPTEAPGTGVRFSEDALAPYRQD